MPSRPGKTSPDDDESVLDAMKEMVARVNRKARALELEFETVDRQSVGYYGTLASAKRSTARRAAARLSDSQEPKLREIGAKLASAIGAAPQAIEAP